MRKQAREMPTITGKRISNQHNREKERKKKKAADNCQQTVDCRVEERERERELGEEKNRKG